MGIEKLLGWGQLSPVGLLSAVALQQQPAAAAVFVLRYQCCGHGAWLTFNWLGKSSLFPPVALFCVSHMIQEHQC